MFNVSERHVHMCAKCCVTCVPHVILHVWCCRCLRQAVQLAALSSCEDSLLSCGRHTATTAGELSADIPIAVLHMLCCPFHLLNCFQIACLGSIASKHAPDASLAGKTTLCSRVVEQMYSMHHSARDNCKCRVTRGAARMGGNSRFHTPPLCRVVSRTAAGACWRCVRSSCLAVGEPPNRRSAKQQPGRG
jgi:hypothetical protein